MTVATHDEPRAFGGAEDQLARLREVRLEDRVEVAQAQDELLARIERVLNGKFGTLTLGTRESVRNLLDGYKKALQDESILEEANRLVYGDRQADYGHPADDYGRTAQMWSSILGFEVTAKQAALCMVAVKLSRECHKPSRDNLVDGAGYFGVAALIQEREDETRGTG